MYERLGTDISHWQGQPDFGKMKEHGISFLFAKAGEYLQGKQFPEWEDPQYKRNRAEAKRVGIPFGAYYYFHPAVGASDQARQFLRIVGESEKPDFPLVIDLEVTDARSPQVINNNLYSFVTYLEQRGWAKPIIYTRNGFWVNDVGNPAWGREHVFWIAQYPRTDIITKPFSYTTKPAGLTDGIHRVIWQFTERMQLAGLPNLDGDWWTGTEEEFVALSGHGVVSPPSVPEELPTPVESDTYIEIICKYLRLRPRPMFDPAPTLIVEYGQRLLVMEENIQSDGIAWYKVAIPDRYGLGVGYVSANKVYSRIIQSGG